MTAHRSSLAILSSWVSSDRVDAPRQVGQAPFAINELSREQQDLGADGVFLADHILSGVCLC